MKLGTATSVFYLYDLKDAVPLIAKAGFDGVDVWGGRPHVYRQDFSPAELRDLRALIEGEGLAVSSFMPAFYRYPHSLSSPNPKVRADSIQYMRECVDNAAVLGARVVLVVPDHSLYGQKREDSLRRMTESIAEVVRARAEGVTIYGQTQPHYLSLNENKGWKVSVSLRSEESVEATWEQTAF